MKTFTQDELSRLMGIRDKIMDAFCHDKMLHKMVSEEDVDFYFAHLRGKVLVCGVCNKALPPRLPRFVGRKCESCGVGTYIKVRELNESEKEFERTLDKMNKTFKEED